MLGFINGTKYFNNANGTQVVLNKAMLNVKKGEKVGILAEEGSGKSTIIKILAGILKLNSGFLIKDCTTWPLGYSGVFHPFLTANENIKIIAQLNYLDPYELSIYCQDFAEVSSNELNLKISAYSGNMRAKLGFALSLVIPCDFFLADEKLAVGDEHFKIKCEVALSLRLDKTGLVFFSRNPKLTQTICDRHGVLQDGLITMYDSHEETVHHFKQASLLY